jgi:hypothetical protein
MGLYDFEDLSLTYPKFDYINLLSIDLNLNFNSLNVDEFWVFHQQSRQPDDALNKNTSWTLGVGGKNYWLNKEKVHSMGVFTGIGKSFKIIGDDWTTSLLLNVNPTYNIKSKWSVIFDPAIEQRIFFTQRLKAQLSISNPLFIESENIFNIHSNSILVFNIKQNISFNAGLELNMNEIKLRTGLKFNLPY